MKIVNLQNTEGRRFPAGRQTKNLVGGTSPLSCDNFNMGYVVLDARGGQVPWHNHEQEEIYFILEGTGEMCLKDEKRTLRGGEAVLIPALEYHQLTNTGDEPLKMIYCYGPAGEVAHWKQELDGTLPREGVDAPSLPAGAQPQFTEPG